MLIVACDAASLDAQGHTLAQGMYDLVGTAVPTAIRRLVRSTRERALLLEFAKCLEECNRFDIVVLVGHSNASGLCLTADGLRTWENVANWVSPLRPKRLILVACQGGRWLPCRALFGGVPTLQEILGSPIPVTDTQATLMTLVTPYLLLGGRLPKNMWPLQLANVAVTGGLIIRRTRDEFRQTGSEEGVVWTVLEEAFSALLAG